MRRAAAARPADVRDPDAAVCSRVGLEREWVADPAPAGSSVGRACRQSVCREAVRLASHSVGARAGYRADRVRHPATEREAEPVQPELVLSQNSASRK